MYNAYDTYIVSQVIKDIGCETYYEFKRKAEKLEECKIAVNQPQAVN